MQRDLKPANVLLTNLDPELACVKLADFGFAKFSREDQLSNTVIGSPLYMAPEVHENSSYDSKIDVWSFGVLASQLLGTGLFSNLTTSQELSDLQKHLTFSQLDLPPDAIEVLEHSLVYEAQHRFSFEELRALPFFHAALIPLDLGNSNPFTLSSVQIVQSDCDGRTQNYLDMSCRLHTKIRKIWDLGWEMDRCGKKLLAVALFQIDLKEIKQYQVDIQNKLNEHADSGLEKLQREAAAKAVEAAAAVSTTVPFLSASELSSLSMGVDLQLFIDEAIQRVQVANNGQRPLTEKQKSYQDALTLLLIVRNEGGEGVQPLIDQYCDAIYEIGLLVG
jgi:serine/threonine protein kinase